MQWSRPPARKIRVWPTQAGEYISKGRRSVDRIMDEITRRLERRLASLEQDAREPRLAMVADGPADTKTRKRTEGAATSVQAMHGDRFSASRVDPGSKTNSTSFGVNAEPPASLAETSSWSRTALRHPSRVSHPWRCAQHQPPVAYFLPAKSLQQ